MKKHKLGFTLSEMLIAMTILGILGVVLSPILSKMMPNQNKVMIKRSYYVITNTVQAMLDDDTLYSPFGAVGSGNETTPIYKGFDNTNSITFNGKVYSGQSKFANIFTDIINAKRVGTDSSPTVSIRTSQSSSVYSGSYVIGVSKDKIIWRINSMPITNDMAAVIVVDVNGDKGPNCFQSSSGACASRKKDFDRYTVAVYNDGKILLNNNDEWVRTIINASSSVGAE